MRDRDPPHPFHTKALDIWGPASTPDLSGNRYVLGAVCYTPTSIVIALLKFKSDIPLAWTEILDLSPHLVTSQLASELTTTISSSAPPSLQFAARPHHCGTYCALLCPLATLLARIERQWRTLSDGAKALLLHAHLPDHFLRFAFISMIYVRNRSWSKGAGTIPFTALTGRDPDLSNLRVLGCPAYVHIDSSQRLKFSPKACQVIFLGHAFDSPS